MGYTGRCLCGKVRYEIAGEIGPLVNCHCRFCRRAHGAAFSTVTTVRRERLHWTAGEALIRAHGNETGSRHFCSDCGTRLYNDRRPPHDHVALVVASLDQEPARGPVMHVNVESKAGWYRILDELPQHRGFPETIAGND